MTTKTKTSKPAAKMITFEVFYNGEVVRNVEFASLRTCNNWVRKTFENPALYVVKTPDCGRDNVIRISKNYFNAKHRIYPDVFPRPEWDVVTPEEIRERAEQAIIRAAKERTGQNVSIQVGGGKYDVTLVHFDKPMRDRVEIIKGDLTREQAYDFVSKYAVGA